MRTITRLFVSTALIGIGLTACNLIRTPEECEADLSAMQDAVATSVDSGLACVNDSDCTVYDPSNGCFGSCPVAVNAGELPRIDQQIAQADERYCTGFGEQCGYTTPSCPELSPVCQAGRCALVDGAGGP